VSTHGSTGSWSGLSRVTITGAAAAATAHAAHCVQEENQEAYLRKAEMEAQKATNLVEHEAEIFSRPKREWFVSARQKRQSAADAAALAATGTGATASKANGKAEAGANKGARKAAMKGEHCSVLASTSCY
jgi:hypothetical protein